MPAVTLTGVLRPYCTWESQPRGHSDRILWRAGRQKGRPEIVRMHRCRKCGRPVYGFFKYGSLPREADGSPQTCENCAWGLKQRMKKLPGPSYPGDKTWYERAFLYAVAQLYLSEYKKAKQEHRI
jgi:hypothetical protein